MSTKSALPQVATRRATRWLFFIHRWIGIFTCLLCVMWFLSGLVMMYVPFPAFTERERLDALPAIDPERLSVSPQDALAAAGLNAFPSSFGLEMLGEEPVYRIKPNDRLVVISAASARRLDGFDADGALALLRRTSPGHRPAFLGEIVRDQWTVSRKFDPHRPLYLFSLRDSKGTHVYLSSRTGEIVQNSTRSERFWNWLGSVPHWIYFTPIRTDGEFWRQVVMWTSGPVIIGALTGLWIGVLRVRLKRRYSENRISPYRGWMKWHHMAGLIGDLFLTTWIASGWLSVNPFQWFSRPQISPEQLARYAGAQQANFPIDLEALRSALRRPAKEASFTWLAGEPIIIFRDGSGKSLSDGRTGARREIPRERLLATASRLMPNHQIASSEEISQPDLYWYSHHNERPLPVLRVAFDDPAATWVYIDPATGEILDISDASARTYRWLFNFLHDFDLPVLLHNRPAWDVLVWMLVLVGLTISVSGVVIGWRSLAPAGAARLASAPQERASRPIH